MLDGGRNIISDLRKRWTVTALISQLLLSLAIAIIVYAVLYKLFVLSFYILIPLVIVLIVTCIILYKNTRLTDQDVSRFLNYEIPSVQESAHLLLKPSASLTILEKIQLGKIENELTSARQVDPFKKRFIKSIYTILAAIVLSYLVFKIPITSIANPIQATTDTQSSITIPEKILPQIQTARIIITPPAYTGKNSRQQNRFNLQVEEGGTVLWQVNTNIKADTVMLIFNDGHQLILSHDNTQTSWKATKKISTTGFYQVKIEDQISELYKIEIIKDKAPAIVIQTPKPTTFINYGQNETVLLRGTLTDDYGLRNAYISATISSGKGEGVKFKEQQLSFTDFKSGQKNFQIQKSIDCKKLGMRPGDELYFYITSSDNKNQETRSEVYIITLQDTTNMTSMNGMVSPMEVELELFRSQRQIIIETEQLLKNKSKISAEEFTAKSNDLGMDQKLLRMRYGKFLGEETDVDIGGDHQHEEEEEHKEEEQSSQDIIDQYSHKHDNAEDATFFDAETKKQLKATLAEMWKAEMKLRIILPKEALPFEYKALKLLKELQQKSRVYVAKTGLKTTPIQLDKRFTGDLSKINQPIIKETIQKPNAPHNVIRKSLSTLELIKENGNLDKTEKDIIQKAFYQLSVRAANEPSVYIPSLSALKNILTEKFRVKDIHIAQQGLQRMLSDIEKLPYQSTESKIGLSRQYFINLKKGSK